MNEKAWRYLCLYGLVNFIAVMIVGADVFGMYTTILVMAFFTALGPAVNLFFLACLKASSREYHWEHFVLAIFALAAAYVVNAQVFTSIYGFGP